MDSIRSLDQVAAFLRGLDPEYEQYAEAFWNNGKGFSKFRQIASSAESFLVQELGVSEFHAGHIKEAAAKSQGGESISRVACNISACTDLSTRLQVLLAVSAFVDFVRLKKAQNPGSLISNP
jgi:hypothetical protein